MQYHAMVPEKVLESFYFLFKIIIIFYLFYEDLARNISS